MNRKNWRDSNAPIGDYNATRNADNSLSNSYNKTPTVRENSTLLKATSTKPSVGGQRSAPQFPGRRKDDHLLSTNVKDRALVSPAFAGEHEFTISAVSRQDADDAVNGNGESAQNTGETNSKSMSFRDLPRAKKFIILMLTIAHAAHMMTLSLLGPFYPQEALKKGTSESEIGLIFSVFAIAVLVSTPFYGAFTVKIGPKFLLYAGIAVSGSCCMLFGLLEYCPGGVTFTVMSFLIRGFDGLGVSAYNVGAFTIAFNTCPDHVTFVAGLLESAVTIGMAIGPAVGSFLFQAGGFGLPFYVIGAAIIFTGVLIFFCIPPTPVTTAGTVEKPKSTASRLSLFRSPLVWYAFFSTSLFTASVGMLSATLALHATQLGASVVIIGIMFTEWPICYALGSPVVGWFIKRPGVEQVLSAVGFICVGFGFAIIGPSPILPFLPQSLWILYVGLIVIGFSFSMCVVTAVKLYFVGSQDVGLENSTATYGVVSGLISSSFSLGACVGPAVSAAMVVAIGFPLTATVVTGLAWFMMLVGVTIFLLRIRRRKSEEKIRLLSCVDSSRDSGKGVEETSLVMGNGSKKTGLDP